MKRYLLFFVAVILALMPFTAIGVFAADPPFNTSAQSAVLYCVENGEFIYEKNSEAVLPMASLTKVMTAVVVLETATDLDREVTIPLQACGIEGSSIYLTKGEVLTIRELLYALMLESANDAATALALSVSESTDDFTRLMNEKADQLSLSSSNFTNPHGLDGEDHHSSAKDLALLFDHAMKNESFAEIASTKRYEIPYAGNENGRLLINHNRLLSSYEGCVGGKTGYTKRCGRCLVSAAKRDGVTLIAVTLNDPDDWDDHRDLFDYGFSLLKSYTLIADGTFTGSHVINGNSDTVRGYVEPLSAVMREEEYNALRPVYNLKRFYFAPISKDSVIGNISWFSGTKLIGKCSITATDGIESIKYKRSIFERFFDLFR